MAAPMEYLDFLHTSGFKWCKLRENIINRGDRGTVAHGSQ